MGLSNALNIGRSSLLVQQAAIEVVGNNLANVATQGYKKQSIELTPADSYQYQYGIFVGQGVELSSVRRQVDEALEARLRSAVSDTSMSQTAYELLTQVESIQNEYTDIDLSSRLTEFFNSWSQLAGNPQDASMRTLVLQESTTLAEYVQTVRSEYNELRTQVDERIGNIATTMNDLLTQIEQVNQAIMTQENGAVGTSTLRDTRDQLLTELSGYVDISTIESGQGVVDVYVGSTPLIINGRSRGIDVSYGTENGQPTIAVVVEDDQMPISVDSGELGALVDFRENQLSDYIDTLDTFSNNLIYEVNKLHSSGQSLELFDQVTATNAVEDNDVALNDEDSGIDFPITNGSFQIHLVQKDTDIRASTTIDIDLDGIDDDTTLQDVADSIDAIDGISAEILANGKLQITSDNGDFQLAFSDDTSGVLAALGINTVFSGSDASDIAVNQTVFDNPYMLVAGSDFLDGDNSVAMAIANLADEPLDTLSELSLTQYWARHVEDLAVKTAQAQNEYDADTVVQNSLEAQQQAISGVSSDEEAIDLIRYQRAYQATARYISIIDEMMQTLISTV